MPNQVLQDRIQKAQREVGDAERVLRRLALPGGASGPEVIVAARAKLRTARDVLGELNAMLAAAEFDQAIEAVTSAERNLTMVLDDLLAPTRTTIATAVVLEALQRLDTAKVRLGVVQELTRPES